MNQDIKKNSPLDGSLLRLWLPGSKPNRSTSLMNHVVHPDEWGLVNGCTLGRMLRADITPFVFVGVRSVFAAGAVFSNKESSASEWGKWGMDMRLQSELPEIKETYVIDQQLWYVDSKNYIYTYIYIYIYPIYVQIPRYVYQKTIKHCFKNLSCTPLDS